MTFHQATGNLLGVSRGIIVHGCNAQGVMGSGVAAAVRATYPGAYQAYKKAHDERRAATGKSLQLGRVIWFKVSQDPPLAIANAVTQEFYGRNPSARYVDYDALRQAFSTIGAVARRHDLPVHYPLIGAGLGGGDWARIKQIIDAELDGVAHTLWTLPGMPAPSRGPAPR